MQDLAEDIAVGEMLRRHGVMRLSELSDRLKIAARSTTEVIDALQARDLAGRQPDPDDRRATLVELTDHGMQVLHGIREARGSHRKAPQNLPGASGKGTSSKCSMILGSGGSACLRRSRGLSAAVTSSRYPTSMRVCRST